MLEGTRSKASSSTVRTASASSHRPTRTSWTVGSRSSGSNPRLNARHACGSRSTASTDRPRSARAAARAATVVVLATPPFWFATAITRATTLGVLLLSGGRGKPAAPDGPYERPPPTRAPALLLRLVEAKRAEQGLRPVEHADQPGAVLR